VSPSTSIILIKNATLYSPKNLGLVHLMIAGGKVVYIGKKCPTLGDELAIQTVDVEGHAVIPGFIDALESIYTRGCHYCGGLIRYR